MEPGQHQAFRERRRCRDEFTVGRLLQSGWIYLADAASLAPSREQLEQMLRDAEEVAAEYDAPISVSVPVPACVVDPAAYPHLHFGWCPRGGAEAYYTVSHDGALRPCNHSSVVLGNLRTQSFAELTASSAARNFWSPVPAECQACEHPLRDVCRGGCPAASDECYGTRKRWDPIIDMTRGQVSAGRAAKKTYGTPAMKRIS
jgi:radical SAM protein with 4Fe4S-binding SPASM domain